MSRSGYFEVLDDNWLLIRWRGAVASAIRGRRGQKFLRELLASMDALESSRLIAGALTTSGEVCAIGSVGRSRGMNMDFLSDNEHVAAAFGISEALVREIAYVNDEGCYRVETPEERFRRVRMWVQKFIVQAETEGEIDVGQAD